VPRASGNDICEAFGHAPDDTTAPARQQWKSQECPFVGGTCIKHSHPQNGVAVIYGTCSVVNATRGGKEEVIICPQRLYAGGYATLKACIEDAIGALPAFYLADEYSTRKREKTLPREYAVLLGKHSGKEIQVSRRGFVKLSLDWIVAHVVAGEVKTCIPCEVQSIDITGNYRDAWNAYATEAAEVPNSKHGMNWANVWKRLIPQLILKGSMTSTSTLCTKGLYFVVPDRVYIQFERLVGKVPAAPHPSTGTLTIMTYELGDPVPAGSMRKLVLARTERMLVTEFAKAFGSGKQLPLGTELDAKVLALLEQL